MTSKPFDIGNVTVIPSPVSMMMQAGLISGEYRLNHSVARLMAGSPDNSVFTLLRMMPGVRASGEPSEDLLVWGSGSGESRILFDGYTLFGLKNFNDHISSVNPYMVKDIRLMKGGYGAEQGGRVGAVAEITGISGRQSEPQLKATVSNYTANVFASVPVTKLSVLSVAYRQTFYNLYGNRNYAETDDGITEETTDMYIKPRYSFRDGNIRYTGNTRTGDNYFVSLYGAEDSFKFSVTNEGGYAIDAREKSYQFAGAAGYRKKWRSGAQTSGKLSFSSYTSRTDNVTSVGKGADNVLVITRTDNSIKEFNGSVIHAFRIGKVNGLKAGAEVTLYVNHLNNVDHHVAVPSVFITDVVNFGRCSAEAGLRADFPWNGKPGLQPRISARYRVTEELNATAAWGMYRQFISKIPYQYSTGHYEMIWSLSDSTFLRSSQAVGGLAFSTKGWLVSVEGFWRQTHNGLYFLDDAIFSSDNTVVGVELFAKKEFGRHSIFASYSLANTREPVRETSHEIKAGAFSSAGSFYFSANFVFGTGFSYLYTGGHSHGEQEHGGHTRTDADEHVHSDDDKRTYSRLDVAVTYRLQKDRWRLQAGLSLLNVFDTRNVKYSYRLNDQNNVTNVYTKATPFTPVLYAEILF